MKDWQLIAEQGGWEFQRIDTTNVYVKDSNGFEFKFSKKCFPPRRVSPKACLTPDAYFKFQIQNHPHNETLDFSVSAFEKRFQLLEVRCLKDGHGIFKVAPSNLYRGSGCPLCSYEYRGNSRRGNTEEFISNSLSVHGGKYSYELVEYKQALEKVTIICAIHGKFEQTPSKHLNGQGCPECRKMLSGFSRTKFEISSEKSGRVAQLYLLNCFNEFESFYKIGITTHSVKERYRKSGAMPYAYDVIDIYQGTGADVFNCEKEIFRRGLSERYTPRIFFQGSTECFAVSLNRELVHSAATEYNLKKYCSD